MCYTFASVMIYGIGNDLVEVIRMEQFIKRSDEVLQRVFDESEITYCRSQNKPAEHFAARFAAKEAFFKALGTGWRGNLKFNEVIIKHDNLGKPFVHLIGEAEKAVMKINNSIIHITLSHTAEYAVAMLIIESEYQLSK